MRVNINVHKERKGEEIPISFRKDGLSFGGGIEKAILPFRIS